jgi:translation initiation factor 6
VFKRLDPFGNPNVGVYVRVTSSHLLLPPGLTPENVADLEEIFGLEAIQLTIGGSTLVGSLCTGNKNGFVVADFVGNSEIAKLEATGLNVTRLTSTRLNAVGNNLLLNDKGAICHPDLQKGGIRAISEALDIEVVPSSLAGLPTVGTAAAATNKGVLVHPLASDDELKLIKQCLHAPAQIGTVNHGHGFVGAGIACNSDGFAVGSRSTGIELGRIEEALGFLE